METILWFLCFLKHIMINFYCCNPELVVLKHQHKVFMSAYVIFSPLFAGTCNDYLFPSGPCHSKSSPEHLEKRLTEIINHSQKGRRWHTLSRYSSLLFNGHQIHSFLVSLLTTLLFLCYIFSQGVFLLEIMV